MNCEIKPFDESTFSDAKALTDDLFEPKPGNVLEKILSNPLRKEISATSAGEIVYQDGKAVAFQAAIVRRLFIGKRPFIGIVGSTLCSRPETSPVLLMQLMKATIKSRYGSKLFFANTANIASMKMNRLLGVKGAGPRTCERIRFGVMWVPGFLKFLLPRPKAKAVSDIDEVFFDSLWERYLSGNKGLVSSRSARELRWMFGDGLTSGNTVMLGSYDADNQLVGYIVVSSTHGGKRWMVMDWIALRNDKCILKALLVSAVRHLRKYKRSFLLEMVGYTEEGDRIASSVLPFVRKAKSNSCLWKFNDTRAAMPDDSWFFGAYDGDRAMG